MSLQTNLTPGPNPSLSYSSKERTLVIIAACIGWGLEYYDFQILALCAPGIMKSMAFNPVLFGSLVSIQLVAAMLGGILFGWLADVFGRKRSLAWTILLFSLSTGAIYFWHTLTGFIVLRFLTGFGTGGEWAIGFSLLNEAWLPKRRGLAGGFVQGSLYFGYAFAILVSSLVSNWTIAFAIGALPALGAVWVILFTPESKQWLAYMERKRNNELPPEIHRQSRYTPLVQLFLKENLGLVVLTTLLVFGAQFVSYVQSPWLPTFLQNGLHYSKRTASNILYVDTAIRWISFLLAGWLSDLYGRRKVFRMFAGFQALAFILFGTLNLLKLGPVFIVGALYLADLCLGYYGIFGAWLGELFATRIRSSASAFAYSVAKGVASVAPIFAATIAMSYGYGIAISTAAFGVLLSFIVAMFLKDKKGRQIDAIE